MRLLPLLSMLACSCMGVGVAQGQEIPEDTEIKTTESGLKYSVLSSGPAGGESPELTDFVVAHYSGWLPDGTLFDSSRNRGAPMVLPLGGFVEGWNEALQLMKVGDRFKLTVPPDLGYVTTLHQVARFRPVQR